MKAIPIPPIPELENFAPGSAGPHVPDRMHLLLAHLLRDVTYRLFYSERKARGDYLILDNSAHEFRIPVLPRSLLARALSIEADEIVMPDVPYDSSSTLRFVSQCFEEWLATSRTRAELEGLTPKLMFVPQGSDMEHWRSCLVGLTTKWARVRRQWPELFDEYAVLGLPAKYHLRLGFDLPTMLNYLQVYANEGYEVHLLGWRNLWGLNELAQQFPWIRSIDSAKPFVYARQGIFWDPLNTPEPVHVGRPENYFEHTLNPHQRLIAKGNVSVFARLAKGGYKNGVVTEAVK